MSSTDRREVTPIIQLADFRRKPHKESKTLMERDEDLSFSCELTLNMFVSIFQQARVAELRHENAKVKDLGHALACLYSILLRSEYLPNPRRAHAQQVMVHSQFLQWFIEWSSTSFGADLGYSVLEDGARMHESYRKSMGF